MNVRFLMSALLLQPLILQVPSWDLLIVETMFSAQFEAMEHNDLRWLSGKTLFVLAVAFAKWVSELCALSVARDCLQCHPNGIRVSMWSNPFLSTNLSI